MDREAAELETFEVLLWKGKPLDNLSREELIGAVQQLAVTLDRERHEVVAMLEERTVW